MCSVVVPEIAEAVQPADGHDQRRRATVAGRGRGARRCSSIAFPAEPTCVRCLSMIFPENRFTLFRIML
jgi:hypothetical protein